MTLSLKTINYLQEEQKKLDAFIHQENGLEMKDTFFLRKIALLVEIGETANELKSFKYWKKNKSINLEKVQEELVDCLHFFLSLANCSQINFSEYFSPKIEKNLNKSRLLLTIFRISANLSWIKELKEEKIREAWEEKKRKNEKFNYYRWLSVFEKLCQQIDFDEKKLLEVYSRKNGENRQRQLENY